MSATLQFQTAMLGFDQGDTATLTRDTSGVARLVSTRTYRPIDEFIAGPTMDAVLASGRVTVLSGDPGAGVYTPGAPDPNAPATNAALVAAINAANAATMAADAAALAAGLASNTSADQAAAIAAIAAAAVTVNAKGQGCKGDGVTDDTAAIVAALAALPEGAELFFPPGVYMITAPIRVPRNRTLRGAHSPRWGYDGGAPSCLRAAGSFIGDTLIRFTDEEELTGSVSAPVGGLLAGPNDQGGQRLFRMTLDGADVAGAGGVDGIKGSGLIRDVRLEEVTVRRVTGTGIHTVGYVRLDGKTYYPRGWHLGEVVADNCRNNGFGFNLLNDSTFVDCLAVAATNHGFYVAGAGELLFIGSRSVYNKGGNGWYFTGTTYGNVVMSGCSTDRNQQHGVLIDAAGQPIMLSGCALRRDGRNGNGGGGNYAGLAVIGATAPVIVSGVTTETGVDDDGTGSSSPQNGLRVSGSRSVTVSGGVLWGQTTSVLDGGGNTNLRVGGHVVQMTGPTTGPVFSYSPDPAPFPQPVDQGYAAWAYDVAQAVNTASNALTSGVLTLVKMRLTAPTTLSAAAIYVATAGATLTAGQCLAGLYKADGTLIATSADQSAAWATTGAKAMGLTAVSGQSLTLLPPGVYYVGLLGVGTTMPTLIRSSGQAAINMGLAAGGYRFCTYGSALTALPAALTMTSQAASSVATWAAVS